ncbi:MAG: hypothetical protein K2O96_00340 [Lachnospiraceae bacterium]|nr:hypothetical protein [Lachnospiraceae bacterium]
MKNKIKKILCIVLGGALVFGSSTMSMAASTTQDVESNSIDSSSFSRAKSEMSSEQAEHYEKVMSGQDMELPTEIGESKIVSQDENGTMTVTLVEANDSDNNLSRDATTSSRTFVYNYTSLGVTREAFRVALVCSWNRNGKNSYITNLKGTYTVKDSSFSCSWDKDSYSSQAYHALYLNVYHGGSSTYYIFSATVVPTDSPYISFAGTAY